MSPNWPATPTAPDGSAITVAARHPDSRRDFHDAGRGDRQNAVTGAENQVLIDKITDALGGTQIQERRHAQARQTHVRASWITEEKVFVEWLAEEITDSEAEQIRPVDCLWVCGPEGRGRSATSIAAIEKVQSLIACDETRREANDGILLAYFFCDSSKHNTAEDVLKSLILQLIHQRPDLASHARLLVMQKEYRNPKLQAHLTVENLWKTLQSMLADGAIGRKAVFVVNNIHSLPSASASTAKLVTLIATESQSLNNGDKDDAADFKGVPSRWYITSAEECRSRVPLDVEGVRTVNLYDYSGNGYDNQVRMMLRRYAKEKVTVLEHQKKYSKALSYFASSLIGTRARGTEWVDTTCALLEALLPTDDLSIRRALEAMPEDLDTLLTHSWTRILESNAKNTETLKEILRTLVLTNEDPSEHELSILAGLCFKDLHELMESCRPLLSIQTDGTIGFLNIATKKHLLKNAKILLGLSDEGIQWQHGGIALRAFSHVKECLDFEPQYDFTRQTRNGDKIRTARSPEDKKDAETEVEKAEAKDETSLCKAEVSAYAVKYWVDHASKATPEIAEDLSLDEDFWKPGSRIRCNWVAEYSHTEPFLKKVDPSTLTGLHVAAAVGYRELVAALIQNGHKAEIGILDSMSNSPLHFAAFFGRLDVVRELLVHQAAVNAGTDMGKPTPLHMASYLGHVPVMEELYTRGANPNAISDDHGPVVNAAIMSGKRAAIEQLIECGVSLTLDRDSIDSPLAFAALFCDLSMFNTLVEANRDELPIIEYSKALVKAAEAGRQEILDKLLEFQHSRHYFQQALDAAAGEWNWDIVASLLRECPGLNCNKLFYTAATCFQPQDDMLEQAWFYANGSISPEVLSKSLFGAASKGKENTVRFLLTTAHANPNATGEEYGNTLTAAAHNGSLDIVRLLLSAGADPNAPDGYALQTAAAEGHHEVVQELLSRRGNVNILTTRTNFTAGTALQAACESSQTEVVRLLLENGADPNHGAGEFSPPIIVAARKGEEEILELLVQHEAKLDVFGRWDKASPLISAAAFMPVSSLKILHEAGADINLEDNDGNTALIVASLRGDAEAVEFLLENGADVTHSSSINENALQAALKGGNTDCLKLLIDHVSGLFGSLKNAAGSSEPSQTSLDQPTADDQQQLDHGDEPETNVREMERDESTTHAKHDPDTSIAWSDATLGLPSTAAADRDLGETKEDDLYGIDDGLQVNEHERPDSYLVSELVSPVMSVFPRKEGEDEEGEEGREEQNLEEASQATEVGVDGHQYEPFEDDSPYVLEETRRSPDDDYVEVGAENGIEVSSTAPTAIPFDDEATEVASTIYDESAELDTHEQEAPIAIPDEISQQLFELEQPDVQHAPLTPHDFYGPSVYHVQTDLSSFTLGAQEARHTSWEPQLESPQVQHWELPAIESTRAELPEGNFTSRRPSSTTFGEFGQRRQESPSPKTKTKTKTKTAHTELPVMPSATGFEQGTPTQLAFPELEPVEYPTPTQPSMPTVSVQTNGFKRPPSSQRSPLTRQDSQPKTVWQQTQRSAPSSAYGHFQTSQQQASMQAQAPAQCHSTANPIASHSSPYDGSDYGTMDPQSFQHPHFVYQQQQQQRIAQIPFSPDHVRGYNTQPGQAYPCQYTPYYSSSSSLNTAVQHQHQQHQQRQSQSQLQRPRLQAEEDEEDRLQQIARRQTIAQQISAAAEQEAAFRPAPLKPQRSFFSGGVKNTFEKSRISGFLSRR